MWPFTQPSWKIIASDKQQERRNAVEKALKNTQPVDSTADDQFLNVSASDITKNIKDGRWTALDVIMAFIRRAAYVQRIHNPITEVLFTDALDQARALDEEFKRTGQLKGPLHGVPISIKDHYDIKNYDSSLGFSAWSHKPRQADAAVVQIIREAGGIILCKTNVPQTMLNFECSNPVWGVTSNPWNAEYTCGGSSGGEGVTLATDSTVLGVGSDVGGSLRIPALYCGVYSIKPTTGRISTKGSSVPNPGFDTIRAVPGPMARNMGDMEMLTRLLFSAVPSNDYEGIPPVPYRDVELPKKMKFGYYFEDHMIKTSPANIRAVQETVDALRKAGHECVEFDLPFGQRSIQLFAGLTSADGYRTLQSPRGSDPKEDNLFLITLGPSLPRPLHQLAVWFIRSIMRDPAFADAFSKSRRKDLTEFWAMSADRKQMIKEFYQQIWNTYQFDAIIAPGMACPALPHGATKRLSPLANGTFYYNIVESPVGIIPVTRVDRQKDILTAEWENDRNSSRGSWILNNGVYGRGRGGVYDPDKMNGLPVGIQLVGRHWEDEKIIQIMHIVDEALGPRGFGPGSWNMQSRLDNK